MQKPSHKSKMPNANYTEFAEKFKRDTDHILEFVNNLGHGRTEKRSLAIYAMRQLIAKHARKQGIDLAPTGRYGKFKNILSLYILQI